MTYNPYHGLRLNLGLPLANEKGEFNIFARGIRTFMAVCSTAFEYTLETPTFALWKAIPVEVRYAIAQSSWKVWVALHTATLGTSTALHPSVSKEYAALTTVMWGARLLPMTLSRMRFGLNQIEVNFPPDRRLVKETINEEGGKVRGIYIHSQKGEGERRVLFWLFGGAFLSGDCQGNVGLAETVAKAVDCDVYLADYRLCPESTIVEATEDVVNCYKWLVKKSGRVNSGSQVSILGISSGGGLALRLQQIMAAEIQDDKDCGLQPRSSVLICPWVHYDWETLFDSMIENHKHDLVVTQSVFDYVVPLSERMAGGKQNRTTVSPLGKEMKGCCETLILCSEHEVTWGEDYALKEKMEKSGVKVTFLSWKYMCHVWCLVPLIPEATESMAAVHRFLRK